jgi:STE24 endopeptidase
MLWVRDARRLFTKLVRDAQRKFEVVSFGAYPQRSILDDVLLGCSKRLVFAYNISDWSFGQNHTRFCPEAGRGKRLKKFALGCITVYILYGLAMAWYLFVGADPGVPAEYFGTAADPGMFMNERQLELTHEYSRIQNWLYFLSIPLEWGIYLFVLIFGVSRWMRNRSEDITRFSFLHTAFYVFLLSLIAFLVKLPFGWLSHKVSISYGISTQNFSGWMRDHIISFWIGFLITFLTIWVIYALMRRTKRWWLYAWLLSIPFTLFMMYIQPVVIDPLYNDFYTLQDEELRTDILHLAEQADVPAEDVYEVNMSEKTNALNAYVNGIGSNLRIVLWDTTLKQLQDDEVLFVMAHEIGHYVMNHLIWSVVGSIFLSLAGIYLGARLLQWAVRRWGGKWGIDSMTDIASIPVLLLIFSVLTFAVSPLEMAVSRHYEHQADAYAIEMTGDKEAAIESFQTMTATSLSEVNPPALVKFFSYGHPTMMERILFLQNYQDRADP